MNDAYAAGLFDGEGMVRVDVWQKPNSIHTRYQVIGQLGVTHYPVVAALQAEYGGNINENRHDLRNPANRIQFNWRVASLIACRFFERIVPYLIIKREQVELAIELQRNVDRYKNNGNRRLLYTEERSRIFAERAALAERIKALKKVSFPSLVDNGPMSSVNGH